MQAKTVTKRTVANCMRVAIGAEEEYVFAELDPASAANSFAGNRAVVNK